MVITEKHRITFPAGGERQSLARIQLTSVSGEHTAEPRWWVVYCCTTAWQHGMAWWLCLWWSYSCGLLVGGFCQTAFKKEAHSSDMSNWQTSQRLDAFTTVQHCNLLSSPRHEQPCHKSISPPKRHQDGWAINQTPSNWFIGRLFDGWYQQTIWSKPCSVVLKLRHCVWGAQSGSPWDDQPKTDRHIFAMVQTGLVGMVDVKNCENRYMHYVNRTTWCQKPCEPR